MASSSVRLGGQAAAFGFPALGGLMFGYDIGATAFVITQITSTNAGVLWAEKIAGSPMWQGFVTSSGMAGAFAAAIVATFIADVIGRRREMLLAAVFYFVGSILEISSGSDLLGGSNGIYMLVAGRFAYGLGCGFATHAAPAYIAEMSASHLRGMLVSLKEAAIVAGMVLGYLLGFGLKDVVAGWRGMYAVGFVLAVIYGVGVWFLPFSARWLVLQGRREEARQSLQFILNDGVDEILNEICTQAEAARQISAASAGGEESVLSKLCSERMQKPLLMGLGLVTLQQVSGQPSVLYYAEKVFQSAGIGSIATVAVGIFKFIMTMYSVTQVESAGRKQMLKIGIAMMVAALVALAVTLHFHSNMEEPGLNLQKVAVIGAMLLYVGGYQVGFGPMVWLLVSEIFPLDIRGTAVALAVQMNFFWNLVVTFIVPVMLASFGDSVTFLVFGLLAVFALWFVEKHVIETKGLSLEEIEALFSAKKTETTPLRPKSLP